MSYHDIDDWASETIPPELYGSFGEWINAIEQNFAHHGHYFPKAMVDTLRDVWENKFGYEINDAEVRHEKQIATAKTFGYEEQFLKQRLARLQKRQERYYKQKQRNVSKPTHPSKFKTKREKRKARYQKKLTKKKRSRKK